MQIQAVHVFPSKMVSICISCLLLGTIKQLHWDDLRKSRSQEIGISDSWDLRPRRTWQSLDLAAISVVSLLFVAANFSLTSQWSHVVTIFHGRASVPFITILQFQALTLDSW